MISQERANHPAADEKPDDAREQQHQPCAPEADDPRGTTFDYIDEAIEESMIASDPPALTPQTGIGPPDHSSRPLDRR